MSVVVPVYNVVGYVRHCLMSILADAGDDVEVLVVEDHSTDRSLAIVTEIADGDDRVSVIRTPENIGLGRARNLGLERANGQYVMFVDSDDFLYPRTLPQIIDRCRTDASDLVIFDYARVYWNDRHRRNVLSRFFDRHDEPITLADDPELLRLLNVAWNKAYKRSFLAASGIEFPPGYYEDIPWTYPLLCMAQSISLVDVVALGYRQRRGGSILRTSDERHFELVEQLERLFEIVDRSVAVGEFRHEIWNRAAAHVLAVMAHGDKRLPSERREEFFLAAAALLGPRLPPLSALPEGLQQRAKLRMLASGNYRAFQSLKRVNGVRIRARRSVRKQAKRVVRRYSRYASRVKQAMHRPSIPAPTSLALFTCLWNRPPTGNPWAIYQKVRELAPEVEVIWAVRDTWEDEIPDGVPYVLSGSDEYREALSSAKWLINDVNFPNYFQRADDQIFLQTQHGTPLKFMGVDLMSYPVAADGMDFGKLMRRVDQWTHNLSSNRYSTEVWSRAFPARYEMLEYGYPRNDILVDAPTEIGDEVRRSLGVPQGNTTILYTPTHRDGVKSLELGLDPEAFVEALGDGYTLIVRGHYFYQRSDRLAELEATGRVVDGTGERHVERLYLASDALICDYSSSMFDYALLNRPIVIFGYDWERYRALRGTYFDVMAEAPGPAVRTLDELVDVFRTGQHLGRESKERLNRFRNMFCQFDDGRAAERVVRKLFLDEQPELPIAALEPHCGPKSWNLQRPG